MITELGDIYALLGGSVSNDADRATLLGLRAAGERLVKQYVGYHIEQKTHTEYYPLRGQVEAADQLIEGYEMVGDKAVAYGRHTLSNRVLQLRNLPVRSITNIWENPAAWDTAGGSFPDSTKLTNGSDYQLDLEDDDGSWTGHVFRRSGSWSDSPRSIKIVYVAGLTENELENNFPEYGLAAIETIVKLFNEFKSHQGFATGGGTAGPVVAEHLADWGVTYASSEQARNTGWSRGIPLSAARFLEMQMNYARYLG